MIKPTIEQIQSYMNEKEFNQLEEAEAFFDHFESNGWMVGKTPMKNWQAAVRTWIRNSKKWGKRNESHQQDYRERQREEAARIFSEMEQENRSPSLRLVR